MSNGILKSDTFTDSESPEMISFIAWHETGTITVSLMDMEAGRRVGDIRLFLATLEDAETKAIRYALQLVNILPQD